MNEALKTKPMAERPADPVAAALAAAGAKPELKPLAVARLKIIRSSESDVGNLFAAVTPSGTPFEHVLDPKFWSNLAGRLRIGDTIEVHTDDQLYFGRLLVRDVTGTGANRNRASVAQLELHKFGEVDRMATADAITHRVEHKGPHLKFAVVQIADGKVVSDGHETAEAAEAKLRALVRPAAAA